MTLFSTSARPVSRARYFAAATVDATSDVLEIWTLTLLSTYRAWVLRNAVRRLSQELATTEDDSYAAMRGM
jgi:hypothetical protein